MKPEVYHETLPDCRQDNPRLRFESRPGLQTPLTWWLVLAYKDHEFDEMLPLDFHSLSEVAQDIAIATASQRLQEKLAPILNAEDEKPVNPEEGD